MRFIKDYFNFNKRQERGVLVLSLIFLISISLNHFLPMLNKKPSAHLFENSTFLKQLKLEKFEKEKSWSNDKFKPSNAQKAFKIPVLTIDSDFDPNTISKEDLLNMGLSKYVAGNIHKYRNKGGVFKEPKELAKIYGMEDSVFIQLEPFIKIKQTIPKIETKPEIVHKKDNTPIAKPQIKPIGINSSDSLAFLQVNGIGPFYAGAIIDYRERLGGYLRLSQLKELYKMDSGKYYKMIRGLRFDTISIRQLPINSADFKTILRHPYIDYETTKYIVNKRRKLGKFAALYQLKDDEKMPDSLFVKIAPYLSLE